MTSRRDTIRDRAITDADTDPVPQTLELSPLARSVSTNDTDPTSLEVLEATDPGSDLSSMAPDVDGLLGAIPARPAVAPRTLAETSGEDAARYATLAAPARGRAPGEGAPAAAAVVLNTTEPLPLHVWRGAAARPEPTPANASPPSSDAVRGRAASRARQVTTVPGARPKRGPPIRIASLILLLGVGVVGFAAVRVAKIGGSPATPATPMESVAVEARSMTLPSSSARTPLPGPSAPSPREPIATATPPTPTSSSELHEAPPRPPPSMRPSAARPPPPVKTLTTAQEPRASGATGSPSGAAPAAVQPKHEPDNKDGLRIY